VRQCDADIRPNARGFTRRDDDPGYVHYLSITS
jgi:hypothetical protein